MYLDVTCLEHHGNMGVDEFFCCKNGKREKKRKLCWNVCIWGVRRGKRVSKADQKEKIFKESWTAKKARDIR